MNAGGFFLRDAEAFGEAEGALAVDDAEVDGFGAAALGGGDFVERHAEDLAGDDRVDVFVAVEGGAHRCVLRVVGQDAQLDLRVVGGEQLPAGMAGDEGGANFAAFLGADRDVLQVRVAGAEPAGGGDDLVERAVNAAGFGWIIVGSASTYVFLSLANWRYSTIFAGSGCGRRPVVRGRRRRCWGRFLFS